MEFKLNVQSSSKVISKKLSITVKFTSIHLRGVLKYQNYDNIRIMTILQGNMECLLQIST